MPVSDLKHAPVFFIGMPRSGTTVVFEKYVEFDKCGWLSNYSEMFPAYPLINMLRPLLNNRFLSLQGRKKQYSSVRFGSRYMPQTDEAYAFWDLYARDDFSRNFLLNVKASENEVLRVNRAIAKTLQYQCKEYFATKLTGPGRIAYLSSIFPEARFVHVVRDGRAVVNSLLKVAFWKNKGGFDAPFWENGLSKDEMKPWLDNRHPAILAAIQWRKVIYSIRDESNRLASDQYIEIRYEDFVNSPGNCINDLYNFSGIETASKTVYDSKSSVNITDMNKKYLADMDESVLRDINDLLRPALQEFGYER